MCIRDSCNSDHSKQCLCITSNTFSIQLSACKNYICQCILLFLGSQVASLLIYHVVHQFINDRINCNNLFFCDTRKVVIKCTSVYNVLSCLTDVYKRQAERYSKLMVRSSVHLVSAAELLNRTQQSQLTENKSSRRY